MTPFKDIESDWQTFSERYREKGEPAIQQQQLDLLEALAFRIPALMMAAAGTGENLSTESLLRTFISGSGAGDYESLRSDIMRPIRENAARDVANPLNKAILANLMGLWLGLENDRNLPELPDSSAMRRSDEWRRHQELYRKPPETNLVALP
jgi:hypothetical protein